MKPLRSIILTAGILALFLVTGSTGTAASEPRPFKATLVGHASPSPTADPCVLANDEGGTGQARHMGTIG